MSNLFDKYTKVVEAEFPRWSSNSTIPTGTSLSIVFDHYRLTRNRRKPEKNLVNLYFLSGTGMPKAIWRFYIRKLFELSESEEFSSSSDWQIGNCIAMDLANHGESAVENVGKLGWEFDWREGSHDLIQVAKSLRLPGENVVVGHSMGGFQALYVSTVAPLLFKFAISIEPVTHASSLGTAFFQTNLLPSLNIAIKSEFTNEEEYYHYFRTKSFYKNFHPEILKDLMEAEKMVNRDGTVTAKTSKEQQLICYLSGVKIFPLGVSIMKQVPIPVIFVVGQKATWNEKTSVEEALAAIPQVECISVPDGQHLVNGEQPEEIFRIIVDGLKQHIGHGNQEIYNKICLSKEEHAKLFKENYSRLERDYFTKKRSRL